MELIEVILSKENLNRAYEKVVANKGASGNDEVTVEELGEYIFPRKMGKRDLLESPQPLIEPYNKQWHSQYQIFMKKYSANTAMDFVQTEVVTMQLDKHWNT